MKWKIKPGWKTHEEENCTFDILVWVEFNTLWIIVYDPQVIANRPCIVSSHKDFR